MTEKFINEHEAADQTGMSVYFFRQARHRGTGPAYLKIGARVLYKPSDLDLWFNSHRVDPQARCEAG